jgi:hypothetical protein
VEEPNGSGALRWVSVRKSSEDQMRERPDFVSEDERVVENLLVHLVGDLGRKAQNMKRDSTPRLERRERRTIIGGRQSSQHLIQ